jgi:pimeloyl-ACP methyl ester carboxylesterase
MNVPQTRYATTADGVHIAYQVLGDGPVDFVYVGPWVTHLEYRWDLPRYASYLRRIASFSRLILFDKRGFGMSDPVPADQLPNLETRMDDIRAVMDVVGSDRAVVYGASESGMLALLFAATYPERTLALVIHGSYPSAKWEPGAPWGWREDEFAERLAAIERSWGTEEFLMREFPEQADDRELVHDIYAPRREPGRHDRGRAHGVGHRCPRCPVGDPRSDANPPPDRGRSGG